MASVPSLQGEQSATPKRPATPIDKSPPALDDQAFFRVVRLSGQARDVLSPPKGMSPSAAATSTSH